MAKRNVQIKLLHSDVNNRPLPTSLALGEAVVNTADGIVMFSGASQGLSSYEALIDPSIPNATGGTYFEVGSNLYNLKIRNQITEYAGLADLSGKFLSGTTEGFKLADISDLVSGSNGIGVDSANNVTLGGILSQPTVFSGNSESIDFGTSDSQLSFFRVNSIEGQETYEVPGQGLTIDKNPGGIQAVVDATDSSGTKGQFDLHGGNFGLEAIGNSGDTYTNLYASDTQGGIVSNDLINNSSAYFNLANNGTASLGVQGSGSTNSSGLDLDDTAGGNGLRFIDGRENGAGLEYGADYSANFTNRSLVDKEFVDIAISAATLTTGNGITVSSGNTIDLGGTLTSDVIIDGVSGTTGMFIGAAGPDQQLSTFRVGANNGISLVNYENNQANSNLFLSDYGATLNSTGSTNLFGNEVLISRGDNRLFSITLGVGIVPDSNDSFTINGVTFTEGIDFVGQNDPILDAETIANLVYSGITDFTSVTYSNGANVVYFNFVNPATVSSSFSEYSNYIGEKEYYTQFSIDSFGAALRDGNTGLYIGDNWGGNKFYDFTVNQRGLEYGDDYSATFTDRSLVDKQYVDNAINALDAQDTFVTGATYDNGSANITFTNNDGSTFDVDMSSVDLNDTVVTGGTISYTNEAGVITFTNNDGSTFDVTGITDVQTTGATLVGSTATFTQNDGTTFDLDLSALDVNDTVVTGGTISYTNEAGVITFTNNDGSTFDVNGITDVQTTGGTVSYTNEAGVITFTQNDGTTFDVTGITDVQTTGGTVSYTNEAGVITFTQNDGTTFDVTGITDVQTTGGTVSYTNEAGVITFTQNDGTTFDVTGITDVQTTGATLVGSTATFTQNDGTTFDLDLSALDVNDTFVTGFTYNNANTLTISRNEGEPDLTVNISTFTGVTISTLDANSVIFTDASGKLTTESNFSYDTTTDTMTVGNITVQNGTGSTATFGQGGVVIGSDGLGDLTVHGDLIVLGDTTTISTSELQVEDATITINSSTGTTNATSLGAGIEIQDGDGAGNDIYLKIEELNTAYPSEYTALTGAENRALYTNLHDIIVRQEVDASSPTGEQVGKRVLVEGDALDAGTY